MQKYRIYNAHGVKLKYIVLDEAIPADNSKTHAI